MNEGGASSCQNERKTVLHEMVGAIPIHFK